MMPDARSQAFRDLRLAIAALGPHLQPKAAAALTDLADLVDRLDQPPADEAGDDAPEPLRHLLTLAGPEVAPLLLQQLVADLSQCQRDIVGAVERDDWQSGRNGSHVLMSLAGSVGAVALQSLAEAMNAAAHRQDMDDAVRLLPQITAEIGIVIRMIEATPPVLPLAEGKR
ncbi:MAG: hypothetical protein B7Z10_12435 [Rhodobacterales bacterium 32-66-7]|nr:MAG: hypothetical protein B7Z10_12435 [Rhodobacterales bacterium 32-66-7]OZA02520.1 MAG: hypothetical protein B7Y02_16890 [Rhodobacterales bacterium 17-64-5]